MTATAPIGLSDTAPALVQQGLQPILLKRQRLNPSRPCQKFRQGLSRISPSPGHSGRVHAGRWWSASRASGKSLLPRHSICWCPRRSVQSLSRIRLRSVRGTLPYIEGLQYLEDLRRPAIRSTAICLARTPSKRGQRSAQHHRQCETAPATSFTGTVCHTVLDAEATRVPSHACLTFGKGWIKQASTLGTPLCRTADSEVQIETDYD